MRIGSLSLPLKLVVLTALILTFAGSSTAALNSQNVTTTISGSYIVHFDDETSASQVKAAVVEVVSAMQTIQQQLIADGVIQGSAKVAIEVPSDRIFTESINGFLINGISEEMLPSLLKTSGAINVESDAVTKIDTVEGEKKGKDGNQRLRSMQEVQITPWGVSRVGGPIDISTVPYPLGRIFVMDTGISKNTKDLTIDEWLSTNFAPDYYGNYDPWDWQDYNGHGTHVAGIIAALNNGINVVGVVPGATVVAVKVCSVTNCRYSDIIAGIEHVAKYGAKGDVVNIGFSGFSFSGTHVLNAAVQNTASRGIKFAIEAVTIFLMLNILCQQVHLGTTFTLFHAMIQLIQVVGQVITVKLLMLQARVITFHHCQQMDMYRTGVAQLCRQLILPVFFLPTAIWLMGIPRIITITLLLYGCMQVTFQHLHPLWPPTKLFSLFIQISTLKMKHHGI